MVLLMRKIKITREEFEEVYKDYFKKCIDIVKDCLNNKKVQKKYLKYYSLIEYQN